ncbi:kinesin motor domain-containing protein [Paraphaeosphaeria sporulosa]
MAHGQTLQQLLQLRNPLQLYLKVRDPDTTPTTGSGSETTSATPVKPRGKAPAPSRSSLQVPTQSPPDPYSYGVKTLYLKGERLHDFHRIFDTSRHEDTRTAWHTMRYLAESALIDQQVVLIAYGQSGSGKTATLYEGHKTGPEKIPSFLDYIGELLFKEHGEQKWSIHATWIEVYGKVMYNLAHPRDKQHPARKKAANSNTSSDEVEYNRGGAKPLDPGVFPYSSLNDYILYKNTRASLAPTTLNSADELSKFRKHCLARRHIDGGDANGTSSRGNAVLTLRLFCDGAPRGAIALVDLFGAEEQKAGDVKQKNERGPATNDIETLGKHLQNLSQHKVSPIPPPTIRQSKLLGLLAGILQGDKVMPADGRGARPLDPGSGA